MFDTQSRGLAADAFIGHCDSVDAGPVEFQDSPELRRWYHMCSILDSDSLDAKYRRTAVEMALGLTFDLLHNAPENAALLKSYAGRFHVASGLIESAVKLNN